MLTLEEVTAFSLWSHARSTRAADCLRALGLGRASGDPTAEAGDWGLATLLEAAGAEAPADGLARSLLEAAQSLLDRAARAGIDAVPLGDVRYPALLAEIRDPPVILWLRGRADALTGPSVAIVGSRAASHCGLETSFELAAALVRAGITVVSGLARGIDSAAHRGALREKGVTVGVLGSGVDVIYPSEHAELAGSIAACGAVVSEFPPGDPPLPDHFPRRNRIISGLSLAVVVVEAAERSGSLITARTALEQGREVLAVPGNILSGRYRGSHGLIRDGATLVEDAEDVLRVIRACPLSQASPGVDADRTVDLADDPLLATMTVGESYDLDELVEARNTEPCRLLSRLLELELQGSIRRLAGGRFVRVTRTC